MKKTILIIALCAASFQLGAQGMQFLNVYGDASSAAVAGASIAREANAFALENNMAAASLAKSAFAAEISYGLWQPNAANSTILSTAGYLKLGEKIAVAAQFKNFAEPEYTAYNADGRSLGTFKPSEMAAGLGLSFEISDGLAVGVNAKFASSTLAEDASASAVAADVSFAYSKNGVSAGLAVANIGGKADYGYSSASLPMIAKAGAAYSASGFTASAEVDYLISGGLMASLGAEYRIKNLVAVRAGYHYGDSAKAIPSYASAGLGLNIAGVRINAAYLLAGSGIIDNTMMFGLGYSF